MVIIGDLSGIQDFLFDVRETGGKQAAALRFRSFRMQLMAECISRRVLWALDCEEKDLIFCAAGKFCINADEHASIPSRVDALEPVLQRWLMEQTHGRLRLALAVHSSSGTIRDQYVMAMRLLQVAKLRPWSTERTRLVSDAPWNATMEAHRDARQGHQLLYHTTVTLHHDTASADEDAIAGVSVQWDAPSPERFPAPAHVLKLSRLSRHIPRENNAPIDFVTLANRSRGTSMLGVLKMDADSLGACVNRRLESARDLMPLKDLSQKLENFFGTDLNRLMDAPGSPWSNLYTVFSGGDDLLLVGPWNITIDFAHRVSHEFTRAFKNEKLTLSGGLALVKPKFPIRLAAHQAEELLEQAKEHPAHGSNAPKDQLAMLGDCWKWAQHDCIITAANRLADWTDAGEIQRGWLQTLLELTLLRRGEGQPRSSEIIPAMATSRLSYHVARNWPKGGPARQWINHLLQQFDRGPNTNDIELIHLPAIIRYAMLATRHSKGDDQ
ncbi:MAG: hypothetical protein IT447_02645 [Phycisphaerales bacterium]|jgi:hypothetical protein|nr:hypothetical protein [Phycisphaerales bacterium]